MDVEACKWHMPKCIVLYIKVHKSQQFNSKVFFDEIHTFIFQYILPFFENGFECYGNVLR